MSQGSNLDGDSNAVVQTDKEEQEFEFLSLRELINKQLARVVEELYHNFSVVQTAANKLDHQTGRLVEENRRLRKTDKTAGKGELLTSAQSPDNGKVIQPFLNLGSAVVARPPTAVTVCSPLDPIPTLDSASQRDVTNSSKPSRSSPGRSLESKTQEHFVAVMPLDAQPSPTPNATMVTDFDLDNAQDHSSSQRCKVEESKSALRTGLSKQQSPPTQTTSMESVKPSVKPPVKAPPALAWAHDACRGEYHCANCGSAVVADAFFCGKCGSKRQDGQHTPDTERGDSEHLHVQLPQMSHTRSGKKQVVIQNEADNGDSSGEQPNSLQDGTRPSKRAHQSEFGTAGSSSAFASSVRNSALSSIVAFATGAKQSCASAASNASKRTHKFEVLPIWRNSKRYATQGRHFFRSGDWPGLGGGMSWKEARSSQGSSESDNEKGSLVTEQRDYRDRGTCCIINPNDPRRGFWDFTSLFLVLYDMVTIPLDFFDPPETSFTTIMMWFARMFWTLDMPLSFLTGFVTKEGFIELRPKMIAKRYARSWLILDTCIVLVDWMEVLISNAGSSLGFARMGKASRTFRIVRMLRLLRLARMREVLTLLTERINSEKVVIVADICKALLIILGLAHFIACLWYAVGTSMGMDGSWIDEAGYLRAPLGERYFISLHWSIAQFAGGMDEVTPSRFEERVFAIGMFILAFIVASVFVSSITSSMTQLNIVGSQNSQQVSALRRYLYQNGISNKLAVRVQRNAQHALTEQLRTLPEGAVALLNVVSEPLRVEIHLEMYSPVLKVHPFFAKYIEECPQVMRKVCHTATQIMMVSASDVIFCAGEIPSEPKMYIICSGQLEYEHGYETALIGENQWVSEAVLWVEWMHRGSLMAVTDCRLCIIDAKKFQQICGEFSSAHFDPESYARDFAMELNDENVEPSDLPCDFDPSSHSTGVMPSLRRQQTSHLSKIRRKLVDVRNCFLCKRTRTRTRIQVSSKKTTEFD